MKCFRTAAGALLISWVTVTTAADYVASGSRAYLREGPGVKYDAVRRLDPREPVHIGRKEDGWVRIRTDKGDSGWVRESGIRQTW